MTIYIQGNTHAVDSYHLNCIAFSMRGARYQAEKRSVI